MHEDNKEIWKDITIKGCYYQVSNLGVIYSLISGKDLLPSKSRKGYLMVKLYKDNGCKIGIPVHRLVAMAFIPNPENKPQVNHINGIKHDNRVCNLEWMTCKENINHAYNTGIKTNANEKNCSSLYTNEEVLNMRNMHKNGSTYKDIANTYKGEYSTIWKLVKGINFRTLCSQQSAS